MRTRISLIDREGENSPVEVKVGQKNNGVRDDESTAEATQKVLLQVLRVATSSLGPAFGVTLQGYIAMLNSQLQAQAEKEAANESAGVPSTDR